MGLSSFLAVLRAAGPKDALPPDGAPIPSQAAPEQPPPLPPLPAVPPVSLAGTTSPSSQHVPPTPPAASASAAATAPAPAPAASPAAAAASAVLASQADALLAAAALLEDEAAAAAGQGGRSGDGAGGGDSGAPAALTARRLRERAQAILALSSHAGDAVARPAAASSARGRTSGRQLPPPRQTLQRAGSCRCCRRWPRRRPQQPFPRCRHFRTSARRA